MQNFKTALQNITWNDVLYNHDTNASFECFWDKFSTLFELHFPVTEIKNNKNMHPKNDFMTSGLLTSRITKLKLHKLALTKPVLYQNKYRVYRNLFQATLRASKKHYYETKFKQFSKNPKKSWELLNELTGSSRKDVGIENLVIDGQYVNQPEIIASEFNKFFATAGKKVAESVPKSIDPTSYLSYTDVPDLSFDHITSAHISDILKSFPNKSSSDLDGISLKLLKYVNFEICEPLAHIFSLSLENGIFPTCLKNSRTVPIFKAGDATLCDNYRPISLISTFSKILEKILL
jgi:hypothetical protein